MRPSSKIARVLVAAPLLLALQAQSAPLDRCATLDSRQRTRVPPVPVGPGARGSPVRVADRAILARDVAQTAMTGWRLPAELRIPLDTLTLVYPSGMEVAPTRFDVSGRVCLPSFSMPRRRFGEQRGPCLVDRDGDGRFELVEIEAWNPMMHVIRVSVVATQPLATPLLLTPNPAGFSPSRIHHHRQVEMQSLRDGGLTLVVLYGAHRVSNDDARPDQAWDEAPGGVHRYQPPPAVPPLSVEEEDRPQWEDSGMALSRERARISLAPGIVDAVGLRIRIAPAAEGWTLQVVEDHARPWVHLTCEDRGYGYGPPGSRAAHRIAAFHASARAL